jgi:pyruvate formate-lyase/glycerol dehydratase family glycyl radical enzyme
MIGRNNALRQTIHAMLDAGVRRTTFYPLISESLASTRGKPRPIRRAMAFAHLLDHVEQIVLPHELLAGSITGMWPLAEDHATHDQKVMEGRQVIEAYLVKRLHNPPAWAVERWALMARDHYDARIGFSDLQQVARELSQEFNGHHQLPYAELYRVLENHFVFDYGEQVRKNLAELPWFAANHLSLSFNKALERGLDDLRQEVISHRSKASEPAKQEFYDSTLIALDAVIRFIHRYADTLRQSTRQSQPERANELLQMAAICDKIADDAPQTFREAIQLVWMIHLVSNIGGGAAMSFGRFDQYLQPFYQGDLAAGKITPELAKELVAHLWLKTNEPKMRTVQSLALSGIARDGRDGTNELTYLCLDVIAEVREPYPNTCVRMHENSPAELWEKVIDTLLLGIGQPQIFNDDAMLPGLVRAGFPIEDGRDYYPMGCVEVMLDGLQPTYQAAGAVVFAGLLEMVFNNGGANTVGEPGCPTGELSSFPTFETFLDAYVTQLRWRVNHSIREAEERSQQPARELYDPFASIFVEDCLEKGVDICQGGARYPACFTMNGMGFGTAIDSLAAIKTLVYDRKLFSLHQVKSMLEQDFAGNEEARTILTSHPPAYGNDIEEADSIARRVYDVFTDTIMDHRSPVGAMFLPQMFSYNSHIYRGEATAATPNGRRRGETLSDGPGPSQGRDTRGPTCLINSVAGMDGSRLIGGCGFNIKINPDFVKGPEGRKIFESLLRTYVRKNGMQIQVNLVDKETLRKAQQSPGHYRDIIVRVAGYCEYFGNLDRKLQDEIIRRTEQRAPATA